MLIFWKNYSLRNLLKFTDGDSEKRKHKYVDIDLLLVKKIKTAIN